uniref:Uncharacterized protein n=1 Tax=Oryzias sinensis TaxID=183150 RepID=A0A8C8DMT9_9TELE
MLSENPFYWTLLLGGAALFWRQRRACALYGRYAPGQAQGRCYPAGLAWFLQEVPALLTPLLLLLWSGTGFETGTLLLLGTFVLHYGYRSLIYAFLTRGRPVPQHIIVFSAAFCGLNGVLQGHHLLHCAHFDHTWMTRTRLAAGGSGEPGAPGGGRILKHVNKNKQINLQDFCGKQYKQVGPWSSMGRNLKPAPGGLWWDCRI